MKSPILKSISVLFVFALMVNINQVSAQQAQKAAPESSVSNNDNPEKGKKDQDNKEFKDDYSSKMAKFDQHYNELKQKEAKTNDPAMKADLNNILSKMDACKADMSRYESGSSNMSADQRKQAEDNIKTQMNDIKQMNESAHNKYGKGDKQGDKSKAEKGTKTKDSQTTGTTTTKDAQTKDAQKQKAEQGDKKNKSSNTNGDNPK